MLIHTRSVGFNLTEAIRDYVETRLRSALSPWMRRVMYVVVRLEDVNGPRGGRDMRCQIMATLARRGMVVVEAREEDLYCAIDVARDRLRRAVRREMEQRRARRRRRTAPAPMAAAA